MISLSAISLVAGVTHLALFSPLLAAPATSRRVLKAFPRNFWIGLVLALVAVGWSAWEVNAMPMGFMDAYKQWLWILTPVVFILIVTLMNELLASRALGGILMLSASPVLELQRVNGSGWALVLAVLAYSWVICGMVLMLSPYRFRQGCEALCGRDAACRLVGASGIGVGGVLITLGLVVF